MFWDGKQNAIDEENDYHSVEPEEIKLEVLISVYELFRYFLKNIVPHLAQVFNVRLSGFQYSIMFLKHLSEDFFSVVFI